MTITPAELLAEIWGTRQSGWVFLPFRSEGRWYERDNQRAWPSDRLRFPARAAEADLYFCPLVFRSQERRAANALPAWVLWSDCDAADPRQMKVQPSIAWKSSGGEGTDRPPRYQAVWLLNHPLTPRAAAELSRRIAYAEGCDKGGWDLTQVLRVPGSRNHKYSPPDPVTLLWARLATADRLDPRAIGAAYPPVSGVTPLGEDGALPWPEVDATVLYDAIRALPIGIRHRLTDGNVSGDRSMQIHALARDLRRWGVAKDLAAHMLNGSPLVQSKYAHRGDRRERVLKEIEHALDGRTTVSQ